MARVGTLGRRSAPARTPLPIATSALAAFGLANDGPCAARTILRGSVGRPPAFAAFFLAVAVPLA
jgi:hypothetical protein